MGYKTDEGALKTSYTDYHTKIVKLYNLFSFKLRVCSYYHIIVCNMIC